MNAKPEVKARLSKLAKSKLATYDAGLRALYSFRQCGICKYKLTNKELSECIERGLPPLCELDKDASLEKLRELTGLMGQLRLF